MLGKVIKYNSNENLKKLSGNSNIGMIDNFGDKYRRDHRGGVEEVTARVETAAPHPYGKFVILAYGYILSVIPCLSTSSIFCQARYSEPLPIALYQF